MTAEGDQADHPTLPQRHPAELTTFIAALVAIAAEFGFELSGGLVVAVFAVIGLLPTIVTWTVGLYRDALEG
ncbi:MAG: hypothetical protein ACRDLD_02420 [Thermoleophilaceae bacterium]